MATLLSPPSPSLDLVDKVGKQPRRKSGYKRIRFKSWNPATASSSPKKINGIIQWKPSKTSNDINGKADQRIPDPAPSMKRHLLCPSPLQSLPVNGTRMDPFMQLPIKPIGRVHLAVDYFLTINSPKDPKEPGYQVEGHANPHLSLLFPFALQHAVLFEAIITVCQASMLLAQGKPALEDKAYVHHRGQTIQRLSDKLQSKDCADDAALLTVAMMLTAEYLNNNDAGVGAHLAGLKLMTAMREPWDEEDPWDCFVKAGLEAYKSLGSFVTGQPPAIPKDSYGFVQEAFAELSLDKPVNYLSLPFSPEICTVISRLPPGFSELCLSGRISVQTMHVLAYVTATNAFSKSPTYGQDRLESEIQTMLSALRRLSLMPITPIERYLGCGLVAYCFQLRRLGPLSLLHDPPLRNFVQLIPAHEKPDSIREQNSLIWISMAVAGSLALRTIRMPGGRAVLEHAFNLYPQVYGNWDRLESVLRSFFWTDTIGDHWRQCWEAAMSAREQKTRQDLQNEDTQKITEADETGDIEDEERPIDFEQMCAHARGGPREIKEMIQATKCPFQARIAKEVAEKAIS